MNTYALSVLEEISKKYYWEKEFIQSVTEIFKSLSIVLDKETKYKNFKILERIVEPDRIISFRVPWKDDSGKFHVNTGYRVEFCSVLGPYKGGLRFHASVNQSILKFLGFEQTFKNALTGLQLGGGKGGSNFNPRGKSDMEIMSFCQSFMTELYRHIGTNTDVPAGDIGVGAREIGYLFGQYRRIKNRFEGVLTGKNTVWGGSLLRPEATGYGITYFTREMLATINEKIEGKTVAISGFGNVAWGLIKKINEFGGKVVTLSGPDGYIYDRDSISGDKIEFIQRMRLMGKDRVSEYAKKYNVPFFEHKKPWETKCDIAIPCATENELDLVDAKALLKNGVKCLVEGANLPLTLEAMELIMNSGILYAPGKASNAGGVVCSGFEMSQNAMHLSWTEEQIDIKLQRIMKNIHDQSLACAKEYGKPGDYVAGSNIMAFKRVADAMIDQGLT